MTPDEIAREIVGKWTNLDTWGGTHISSRLKPDEAICAITKALRAAEARGYAAAREQAAGIASSVRVAGASTPRQAANIITHAILAMEPEG